MRTGRIAQDLEKVSDWPVLAQEAGYCSYRLANLLDVQERALRRFFLKKFGHTTHRQLEWMCQEKIEQLAKDGWSLKEIAVHLQVEHATNLSRRFKHGHGVTLRIWLRTQKSELI